MVLTVHRTVRASTMRLVTVSPVLAVALLDIMDMPVSTVGKLSLKALET